MNNEEKVMGTQVKLSKKDKSNVFWRYTAMSNNLYNYETQQAPLMVYSLYKALRKVYPNDEEYLKSITGYFKYYNSNPIVGESLVGASLAMEERDGAKSIEAVQALKTSLMGPFAGIGDAVFNIMMSTIIGSIVATMAADGNIFGPILSFAWGMFMLFFVKRGLFYGGYNSGLAIIEKFGDQLNKLTDVASIMGLTVVGAIIASNIKLQTGFILRIGKLKTNIQTDMIDKIMPALLPIVAVFIIYKLLGKKNWTPTRCIGLVIAVALLGAFFGILSPA
ncbi:PTS system mannose/fructose/sorbose family transporter subunit IID [Dellaglioa algida]|uniref:PTS system mannose/fructose/sorbose family transporter subunit IID n=1 Tax=Dellaglioa algida TaxID=105612 RepID=UPI0024C4DBAD|nr:PTS system mannose/fructose/sorbose family transporter subunit IID [Dellaglioa algida]MDK1726112.1 PTS system mannose/fructose/sorbose family transporter subunit IID [Dellaglioa algida]